VGSVGIAGGRESRRATTQVMRTWVLSGLGCDAGWGGAKTPTTGDVEDNNAEDAATRGRGEVITPPVHSD
jgi:hypothetical protein